MRHRLSTLALASAAAVLLSGCGSAWPASEAEERFVEHFTTTYPDHVVDTVTESAAKWPFAGGDLSALVVLADDTPPEMFDQILQEVLAWDPGNSTAYAGRGVVANGLGICAGDEQREAKQTLRDSLYAAGSALEGSWHCTTWDRSEGAPYKASVADFQADTAAVHDLLGGDTDLRVRAELNEPWGNLDAPWAQVPPELEDALAAVSEHLQIRSFEFTVEHGLRVAVSATTDLGVAQQAAAEAAGPELTVEVVQGDLDPVKAADIALLAPVADHVRTVPGVTGAEAQPGRLGIGVEGPEAVASAIEAATTHPDLGTASVGLTLDASTPDDPWARHRYSWHPGTTSDSVPTFVGLVQHEQVATVQLSDRPDGESPMVTMHFASSIEEGLPRVKSLIPDGMVVTVKGDDGHATVDFVSAPTLSPEDLTTRFTTPDLDQIARGWNAAG